MSVTVLQCRAQPKLSKGEKRWSLRVRFRASDPNISRVIKTYHTRAYFDSEEAAKEKAPYLRWFIRETQSPKVFEQEWKGSEKPDSSKFYHAYQAWLENQKEAEGAAHNDGKKRKAAPGSAPGKKKRKLESGLAIERYKLVDRTRKSSTLSPLRKYLVVEGKAIKVSENDNNKKGAPAAQHIDEPSSLAEPPQPSGGVLPKLLSVCRKPYLELSDNRRRSIEKEMSKWLIEAVDSLLPGQREEDKSALMLSVLARPEVNKLVNRSGKLPTFVLDRCRPFDAPPAAAGAATAAPGTAAAGAAGGASAATKTATARPGRLTTYENYAATALQTLASSAMKMTTGAGFVKPGDETAAKEGEAKGAPAAMASKSPAIFSIVSSGQLAQLSTATAAVSSMKVAATAGAAEGSSSSSADADAAADAARPPSTDPQDIIAAALQRVIALTRKQMELEASQPNHAQKPQPQQQQETSSSKGGGPLSAGMHAEKLASLKGSNGSTTSTGTLPSRAVVIGSSNSRTIGRPAGVPSGSDGAADSSVGGPMTGGGGSGGGLAAAVINWRNNIVANNGGVNGKRGGEVGAERRPSEDSSSSSEIDPILDPDYPLEGDELISGAYDADEDRVLMILPAEIGASSRGRGGGRGGGGRGKVAGKQGQGAV